MAPVVSVVFQLVTTAVKIDTFTDEQTDRSECGSWNESGKTRMRRLCMPDVISHLHAVYPMMKLCMFQIHNWFCGWDFHQRIAHLIPRV